MPVQAGVVESRVVVRLPRVSQLRCVPAVEMLVIETVRPLGMMVGNFMKIRHGDWQTQYGPERKRDDHDAVMAWPFRDGTLRK